jgi:hypothetical protein
MNPMTTTSETELRAEIAKLKVDLLHAMQENLRLRRNLNNAIEVSLDLEAKLRDGGRTGPHTKVKSAAKRRT